MMGEDEVCETRPASRADKGGVVDAGCDAGLGGCPKELKDRRMAGAVCWWQAGAVGATVRGAGWRESGADGEGTCT